MTELQDLMANGAGSTAPTPQKGFTAGETWDGDYDLSGAGVNAHGTIPMPNQTKIDRFQREMAKHVFELEEAARKEDAARTALGDQEDTRSVDEKLAEVDKALELKAEVYGKFAEATAKVCSNQPTAKQLKSLPEYELNRFINHVTGLINPNA